MTPDKEKLIEEEVPQNPYKQRAFKNMPSIQRESAKKLKVNTKLQDHIQQEEKVRSPEHRGQELATPLGDQRMKVWLPFALGAAGNFFAGNCILSTITAQVDGLATIFYVSAGAVFCGALHISIMSCKKGGWHKQNLIVNGKIRKLNIVRFLLQCCLFFGIQSFIFLTMYYAHMADVNVGIITTLWSIQPLAAAFLDYLINGERLTKYHVIGIVMVIASGFLISFSKAADPIQQSHLQILNPVQVHELPDEQIPKWVAVLFGILTPCFFVASGLFIKHLTSPKVGFDAMTISFSTSCFSSILILIIGVSWYWREVETLNKRLFIIGFFGSIFDSCGKACIQKAYSNGPAGPVSAFVELNNVVLIIFEAIRYMKMPNYLEFLGFIFAIIGALVLCIPEQLSKLIKAIFCCRSK